MYLLARLFIVASCVLAVWLLWIDHRIQNEFEGKRWSLPARVYASATEVYIDQALSIDDFEKELKATGYEQQAALISVGQYQRFHNNIEFIKRPFVFWDGTVTMQHLRVSFSGGKVSNIRNVSDGKSPGVFRLEPQLIGKIYPQHNEDRVVLPYRQVPPFLIDALVAVEDRHFFSHSGLDLRGIARALLINISRGQVSQGGSTLTQQLVKNFFLTHERTYWRNLNEMIMSLLLELQYSKSDILSAYINRVYLGQHGIRSIHGFGTAAEYYFAKPLQELRKDQIALLVGLVRGASYYNPYRHPKRALKRRNLVLQLMQAQNYPEVSQLKIAQSRALDLASKPRWGSAKYPAFIDLVKRQLLKDYKLEDLRNEGLRIFTTLNPGLQEKIETAANSELKRLEKQKKLRSGSLETAVVVVDIASGAVVGLIGGRQRDKVNFNRAIEARRPIGSLIKPLVYYAALSRPSQYNVLSIIDDSAISVKQNDNSIWQPQNYDRRTHGHVTLLEALVHSYNQATVRLGMQLGLERIIQLLREAGIKEHIDAYPSLLLGSIELNPLEVAQIYQSFANGGFQVPYNSIREVLTSDGSAVQRYPLEMNQVFKPAAVFLTNYLMTQVIEKGTAKGLFHMIPDALPLAGKTGTTNDLRDSWFAGFGDELLSVVWVGQDNNESTRLTGAGGAMHVWARMMRDVKIKALNLVEPEDIEWLSIQKNTCLDMKSIPYIRGYKPAHLECK